MAEKNRGKENASNFLVIMPAQVKNKVVPVLN
jgi:hypothetical protein